MYLVPINQAGHLWTCYAEKVCLRTVHQRAKGEIILFEALFHILSQNPSHRELTNLNFLTVSLSPFSNCLQSQILPRAYWCFFQVWKCPYKEQGSWSTSDGKTEQALKESVDCGSSWGGVSIWGSESIWEDSHVSSGNEEEDEKGSLQRVRVLRDQGKSEQKEIWNRKDQTGMLKISWKLK